MRDTVMRSIFGSHLYGTDTELSDRDYKEVYIPSRRQILLHSFPEVIREGPSKEDGAKNTSNDVDVEIFSLCKYVKLLLENQTVALDMLFSIPESKIENECWRTLYNNRERFRSKNVKSFIGYCRQQANKYGIKGSRVAAVQNAWRFFSFFDGRMRVNDVENNITAEMFPNNSLYSEHITIEDRVIPSSMYQKKVIKHLAVCNRLIPFTVTINEARQILHRLDEEYGKRSREAMHNENIDWKALSHAVRIGQQSIEYLMTGSIIFPRPNAQYLLDIKLGNCQYVDVASKIEDLLAEIEEVARGLDLPDNADTEYANDFIYYWYSIAVA